MSILKRFGVKEVCNGTFYRINADGTAGAPALFLDSLKMTTVETTGEQTDARGGYGNPKLITWDYNKDITVNIEDALFTTKSLNLALGGEINETFSAIKKAGRAIATATTAPTLDVNGDAIPSGAVFYDENEQAETTTFVVGQTYVFTYEIATGYDSQRIEITPNSFPGTWTILAA